MVFNNEMGFLCLCTNLLEYDCFQSQLLIFRQTLNNPTEKWHQNDIKVKL